MGGVDDGFVEVELFEMNFQDKKIFTKMKNLNPF